MTKTLDLWPQGIETHRVQSPVAILRSQAALLGAKTKNLVQAEVTRKEDSAQFVYKLMLIAPSLGFYKYQLLAISHEIELYPVKIVVEPSIQSELPTSMIVKIDDLHYVEEVVVAESEEEFIRILGLIFQSQKTRRVITSLMSQSDPDWEEVPF